MASPLGTIRTGTLNTAAHDDSGTFACTLAQLKARHVQSPGHVHPGRGHPVGDVIGRPRRRHRRLHDRPAGGHPGRLPVLRRRHRNRLHRARRPGHRLHRRHVRPVTSTCRSAPGSNPPTPSPSPPPTTGNCNGRRTPAGRGQRRRPTAARRQLPPNANRSAYDSDCTAGTASPNPSSATASSSRVGWFSDPRPATPTGNLTAILYAHTGTFGTSERADRVTAGDLDDTSMLSTVTTTPYAWFYFDFDGTFTLAQRHPVLSSRVSVAPRPHPDCIKVRVDESAPTHAGNQCDIRSAAGRRNGRRPDLRGLHEAVTTGNVAASVAPSSRTPRRT